MAERLPRMLLRVEGLAVAVAAVALYVDGDHSWWLFALLILAPDLGIAGYAAGPRVGALTYDVVHTSAPPLLLGVAGVLGDSEAAVAVALVWLAHIGVDRAVGYGLKYPTAFKDTHLQRV
ncbi:MAG TPA: DUF4260 domain-containing protein [Gaiellaceae bacterium]|nr:DUF4260 domain-containing protein [Gaiellaceae bacterium]